MKCPKCGSKPVLDQEETYYGRESALRCLMCGWRQPAVAPDDFRFGDGASSADRTRETDRIHRRVIPQAIDDSQRTRIIILHTEGRTFAEIGAIVGRTQSAIGAVIYRARRSGLLPERTALGGKKSGTAA